MKSGAFLSLLGIFRQPYSMISFIISSGEMLEYISKNMSEGLRTEDVSRIAYQVRSCAWSNSTSYLGDYRTAR